MEKYYYNGEWLSYDELYASHGVTEGPSTPVVLYSFDLVEVPGWEYETKTWIVKDNRWYSQSDNPYYKKLNTTFDVYYIGSLIKLPVYANRGSDSYAYNGTLSGSFEYLHNQYGLTKTPSTIYHSVNGVVKCIYNTVDGYWDSESHVWSDTAPSYDDYISDIDQVGSIGLFLYSGIQLSYGSIVSGDTLIPASLNFPPSGNFSCTKMSDHTLTGSWRILSPVSRLTSIGNPCVVLATKTSTSTQQSTLNYTPQATEVIEYNL